MAGLPGKQQKALALTTPENVMIWSLRWMKAKGSTAPAVVLQQEGTFRAQSASALLGSARRQRMLENIWQKTSLSREQFQRLYLAPIQRFAEMVQQIPASQNHHHAYPGGMLDHGLEVVAYALKIRQSYLLPLGAAPETQAAQADAWSAALAYAALLHDIGKIEVDVQVILDNGQRWHAWHGPITGAYQIRYPHEREYKLHGAAAGFVYTQVLPSHVLDWLSTITEIWTPFIFLLAGQYEHAGILGELVVLADRASVAQELGANPERAVSAPVGSLQRQFVEGLRYLVTEQLKLNQSGASDGWLTQDALWLVSKTVADKLRAHLLAQGTEGIPSSNPTLFNLLQDQGLIQPNDAGKAIWKATVLSGSWEMTLTFIKVSPALIWTGTDRPEVFNGSVTPEASEPSENSAAEKPQVEPVVTDCQDPTITEASHQDSSDEVGLLLNMLNIGEIESADEEVSFAANDERSHKQNEPMHTDCVGQFGKSQKPDVAGFNKTTLGITFMKWLKTGVVSHKIVINDSKAKIHTVAGTAFLVTPELFQRYAQEHVDLAHYAKEEGTSDWKMVQRAFEKLDLHEKRQDGLNIWTCEIRGPRKSRTLKGYLLKQPSSIFASVPYDNPYLKLLKPSEVEEGQ